MKGKELNQSRNKRWSLLWMVMAACLILTGCATSFGPILLNKVVTQYDEAVLQSEEQELLLNIIRMHDGQPAHFTVANSISAQFTLSHTGTLNPSVSITNPHGAYSGSGLSLGKTVSDTPLISIVPMQGKDLAQRLYAPIDTDFVNTLFLQRSAPRLDKMLRLMAKNFYLMGPEKTEAVFKLIPLKDSKGNIVPLKDSKGNIVYNYTYPFANLDHLKDEKLDDWGKKEGFTPVEAVCLSNSVDNCYMENNPLRIPEGTPEGTKPEDIDIYHYKLFRKVVAHIQAMALIDSLYFFSLDFYEPKEGTIRKTNPSDNQIKVDSLADTVGALEKKYHWQEMTKKEKGFILTKRYPITAITDFDFDEMGYKMGYEAKKGLLKQIQKDLELNGEIKLGEGMIIVLLRGDKDNRWPIYGYFTLRNFRQVLQFLAGSLIKDQPGYASEYDVAPSQFTKELLDKNNIPLEYLKNPALTLTINSGRTPPGDRLVDVDYKGKSFWISPQTATPRWNGEVFSMLYEIYQFNNITPAATPPAVTISK